MHYFKVHWALEQQELELRGFTYMWIFFKKYIGKFLIDLQHFAEVYR